MTTPESRLAAISRYIGQQVQPEGPGLALGLADASGDHVVVAGHADLEHSAKITADTVFHVASVSKQFTAYAAALLARDGSLDLEADIRAWLPWLPDFGTPITPRHLIRHTSGICDQWHLFQLAGRRMSDHLTQQQIRRMLSRQAMLAFEPGTAHRYCNSGYSLLAEIVAAVSGKSFRSFCADEIFGPTGMTASEINDDASRLVPGRAASYASREEGWSRYLFNFENYGATSLLTTVPDLLRWGRFLLDDRQPKALPLIELAAPGTLRDGNRFRYGFGLTSHDVAGLAALGHSGADAGFRAHFAVLPDEGLTAVVLCNTPLPSAHVLEVAATLWLGAGTTTYPVSDSRVPATMRDLPGLAGSYYQAERQMLTIAEKDGVLVMHDAFGDHLPIYATGDDAFDTGVTGYGRFRFDRDGDDVPCIHTDVPTQWAGERRSFRRTEPARPTVAELSSYAGTYRCDALDATVTVSLEEGALLASGIFIDDTELRPSVADRFDASGALRAAIAFNRDDSGRITAFRSISDRHGNVLFARQPDARP